MAGDSLLGFDVGNTRIKAGAIAAGMVVDSASLPMDRLADLRPWLEERMRPFRHPVVTVSSVNPPVSQRLVAEVEALGGRLDRIWTRGGEVFAAGLLRHQLTTPETTGIDRVLAGLAGYRRAPGEHVIVVDCGSAVTVNLIDREGVFHGGAIMPGLRLMALALETGTAALPRAVVRERPTPLGRGTFDALASGVYHAVVGGVERLLAEYLWSLGAGSMKVFVTGGDAALVAAGLATPTTLAPHLVLEGLAHATWYLAESRGDHG